MLTKFIPVNGVSSAYGSNSIKALQNDNLPRLDLLVRESIQNSSDAGLITEGKSIGIHFTIDDFNTHDFNSELDGISAELDKRYPSSIAQYLEIRDTGTTGLTGPITFDGWDPNDHGNYWKLVFDTGKNQTNSNGGGSYGYGKSVYYRVGIGIVIFYSRIFDNSDHQYKERLIVTMIEDEEKKDSILRTVEKNTIGHAWWGSQVVLEPPELILPLTEKESIEEILNIFHLKRFTDDPDDPITGTSIIIPYFDVDDKHKLLDEIFPDDCGVPEDQLAACNWKNSIFEYLKIAIPKWYGPRIFNKHLQDYCNSKWLSIRITEKDNTIALKPSSIHPYFRLFQELYTTALAANYGKEYQSPEFPGIMHAQIDSARVEGKKAGTVAYTLIERSDIDTSLIKGPYELLRLFHHGDTNPPVVMYARSPGMILNYCFDGKWVGKIDTPAHEDEYFFAFFLPKKDAILKNDPKLKKYAGKTLEVYLRDCEKSDHVDWEDKSSLTIADRLKTMVPEKITEAKNRQNVKDYDGAASRLSGSLGKLLLPTLSKKGKGGGGGGGGGSSPMNVDLVLSNPRFMGDLLQIPFKLVFKNNRKDAFVYLYIESETGILNAREWHEKIGTRFPLCIDEIYQCVTTDENTKMTYPIDGVCSQDNVLIRNDTTEISLIYTDGSTDNLGFKVLNVINNITVSGMLELKTMDKKLVCTLKPIVKEEA